MKILVLSAYHAQSHQQWLAALQAHICADWHCHTLPARYFAWRIRGNSLSWLETLPNGKDFDLLLVTSMVDLATLKGIRPDLAKLPSIVYFHENQFAYPPSRSQHATLEPQLVNLYSALAADKCLFNSTYNYDSFLEGVSALMKKLPDHTPKQLTATLADKSEVLPVPISDVFSNHQPTHKPKSEKIRILWNHRWEYDKGPDRLHAILHELKNLNIAFELVLTGESFRQSPDIFQTIQQEFADSIYHQGYIENLADYIAIMASCDIVLSTAIHEFQGLAILEACALGCTPVLPNRLSYASMYPREFLYTSHLEDKQAEAKHAANLIASITSNKNSLPSAETLATPYHAQALIPRYLAQFEASLSAESMA